MKRPSKIEWGFFIALLVLALVGLWQPVAPPTPTTTPALHNRQAATTHGLIMLQKVNFASPSLSRPITAPIPGLDLGQAIQDAIFTPILNLYTDVTNWLNREGSILVRTEPTATYQNQAVHDLWLLMLTIVDATLSIFLFLAGYEVMLGGFGFRYATALQVLPRILLAFIGVNISFIFATFWIDLDNLLCSIMDAQTANQPLPLVNLAQFIPGPNLAIILLLLILSVFMVFLGLQLLARLALLVFLLVLLPVLFALLANARTQHIGQVGISSYIGVSLVQFLQLTCLTLGAKMLLPFLQLNIGPNTTTLAPITTILAAIAIIWLTLRIPGLMRGFLLSPIADAGRSLSTVLLLGASRVIFF